jgi:hypothetical protein
MSRHGGDITPFHRGWREPQGGHSPLPAGPAFDYELDRVIRGDGDPA